MSIFSFSVPLYRCQFLFSMAIWGRDTILINVWKIVVSLTYLESMFSVIGRCSLWQAMNSHVWETPFGNSFVCPFCSSQVNTKYINIDEKKNTIITYVSAEVSMWCWKESPDLHSYFSLRYISLSEGLKQENRPMQEAFVLIFHFILYS